MTTPKKMKNIKSFEDMTEHEVRMIKPIIRSAVASFAMQLKEEIQFLAEDEVRAVLDEKIRKLTEV